MPRPLRQWAGASLVVVTLIAATFAVSCDDNDGPLAPQVENID